MTGTCRPTSVTRARWRRAAQPPVPLKSELDRIHGADHRALGERLPFFRRKLRELSG
jgi:hypothetical protein